jgi:hypothetical protein
MSLLVYELRILPCELSGLSVTRLVGLLFLSDRIPDLIMKRLVLFTPVWEFRLTRIKNEREVGGGWSRATT